MSSVHTLKTWPEFFAAIRVCARCRPPAAAPAKDEGTPLTDPTRWHLCRHDILRSDCTECHAAAPAKE
jgi:hypothetical protein